MHITYLQSGRFNVAISEVMARVGHTNIETTMGYTHRSMEGQRTAVKAMNAFGENFIGIFDTKIWSSKYSEPIYNHLDLQSEGEFNISLTDFRRIAGIGENYSPRNITSNILPYVKKDLQKYLNGFTMEILYEKKKIIGYQFCWINQKNEVGLSMAV
jgi:hypothetical protein